jgi:hypothetical protein
MLISAKDARSFGQQALIILAINERLWFTATPARTTNFTALNLAVLGRLIVAAAVDVLWPVTIRPGRRRPSATTTVAFF